MTIEKINAIKKDDSNARYIAGNNLKKETAVTLNRLKTLLLTSDMQYQIIADKLGLEILQCGIDYYNGSEEPDAAIKAMPLQKYALSIVVGKAAKDRCQENLDILQKVIEELPPTEVLSEDKAIKDELRKFCQLPDKICFAVNLLNNTKPYLQTIKQKLGASNTFYLKLSTQVVGNALHNVIEEVNNTQNALNTNLHGDQFSRPFRYESEFDKQLCIRTMLPLLQNTLREAWDVIKIMNTFDMEADFKINRYNQNRDILKKLCGQLGISTNDYTPQRTTSSSRTTTSQSSSSDSSSGPSGCMIAFIILVAIFILSNL